MNKLHPDLEELNYGGKSPLDATTSLYDYLGQAAGPALGKDVYKAALLEKEPVATRKVDTPYYKGKVRLYRKEILKEYFDAKRNSRK